MVDIHSHILYGIDDGSKNIEDSVNMVREAKKNGITHICCTPHYLEPNFISNYNDNFKRLNELKNRLKQENITMKLSLGNEIFITENTLEDLNEKKAINLNNSKYILVEFPMVNELKFAEKIIDNLIDMDYKIIVAHPERYTYVQKNQDYIIPYLNKGIIFQSNVGSIIGMYGEGAKNCLNDLLKRQMVQVLATDTHKTNSTYYKLDILTSKIKEKIPQDYFEELTIINPNKILNNDNVIVRKYKNKKRFIFF